MKQHINIETRWGKLLRVRCMHDFYADGYSNDFEFVPTYETAGHMRNLNLLFRPHEDGFLILYNGGRTINLLNGGYRKIQKLSFLIENKNLNFSSFSNTPFGNTTRSYYFSNQIGKAIGDLNLLHQENQIEKEPDCMVYPKSRLMNLTFKKPISSRQIQCTDPLGNQVDLSAFWLNPSSEKSDQWLLRLREFNSGLYTIGAKGSSDSMQFYVGDEFPGRAWGILDLYLQPSSKKYQIFSKDEYLKPDYCIQMSARETHWRYFLMRQPGSTNNGKQKIEEIQVMYNGEAIPFTKPEPVKLNNGTEAVRIESEKPLKLEQITNHNDRLELRLKAGRRWSPRVVKLPKPGEKMVKPDRENNKIFSTTYVYY